MTWFCSRKTLIELIIGAMVIGATCFICFSGQFAFVKNITRSLPHFGYVLILDKTPQRHDYVAFFSKKLEDISPDLVVIKEVVGQAGDAIRHDGRTVLINEVAVGYAKRKSLNGLPLEMSKPGRIPLNQFFVTTPHPDSFDSRYEKLGLVDGSEIVAVAYPVDPFLKGLVFLLMGMLMLKGMQMVSRRHP